MIEVTTMTEPTYQYVYELPEEQHKSAASATSWWIYSIVILAVVLPLIFFVIQAVVTGDAGWLVLAGFGAFLLFLFGPYAYLVRGYYFLAITNENEVIMRSMVNLVPRNATFAVDRIKYIRSPNPTYSPGLMFLDIDRRRLGVFNPNRIPDREFQKFLAILRKHNQILKFLDW